MDLFVLCLIGLAIVLYMGAVLESAEAMKEDPAIAIAETVGKLVHGTSVLDGCRALVTVMSCGICTSSKSDADLQAKLDIVIDLLLKQVFADYPKIKAMQAKGEVNAFILPDRIM